jgi:hypothetical protein
MYINNVHATKGQMIIAQAVFRTPAMTKKTIGASKTAPKS